MKRKMLLLILTLLLSITGCGESKNELSNVASVESEPITQEKSAADTDRQSEEEENLNSETKKKVLTMTIDDCAVTVEWEKNKSVDALLELAKDAPVTVQMSMYGGFEQVGSLGASLPRSDVQTTTSAGDIVLYSGNQIVVFYGSNSWAYTRLGHIMDKADEEMAELLSNGDVVITLSLDE